MRKEEIKVNGVYQAMVSKRLVDVRVDEIVNRVKYSGRAQTIYQCTNLKTNRKIVVRSALKFRKEVMEVKS